MTLLEKSKDNKKNTPKGDVKKVYLPMVNPEIFLDGKVADLV